ncbi:MAG TPA: DUF2069 domain-containing protein [Xanthomonadaceae bacterium]|nr:DUF2069 domain-containing protein [Xanthomonadaceae bacterium]
MSAHRAAALICAVMILNLLAWYLWWAPPTLMPLWLVLGLLLPPLLLALVGLLRGHRSAPFWAGVAALFYFCHGISEAWTEAAARVPALIEAVLAAALVVVPATIIRRKRQKP